MCARSVYVRNWILRHDTTVILDLDIKVGVRQHPLPQPQNFCEPVGVESMIGIMTDVCLDHGRFTAPGNAAAINRRLCDVTHFGDMRVSGDVVPIG